MRYICYICAMIKTTKLKKLRKDLKGHLNKIAKQEGVPSSTVYRVLDGEWENDHIVVRCIEYRDNLRKKKQALEAAI